MVNGELAGWLVWLVGSERLLAGPAADISRYAGYAIDAQTGAAMPCSFFPGSSRPANGVSLSYASQAGRALIDRRVYLPRSWADDPQRCVATGVPAEVEFAAKPQLALKMITGAVAAGMPTAWVVSDELYGDNGAFRPRVAKLGLGNVLAVSCDHRRRLA